MFELTETLDLRFTLAQHVRQTRAEGTLSGKDEFPRVLNQERDGAVIYTWDDIPPGSRRGPAVTHVAEFDPSSQTHKILWSNDSKIYISTCSVNADRTLMAYTTCDPPPVNVTPTQRGQRKVLYRAFLAEISPQKRVFSLNIDRPHYLKVQFLLGPAGGVVEKMAHMLLFLHRESIGLYHIPLARVEKGIIMRDQPKTEQLVKRFTWCQWDSLHQRLFYVAGRRPGRGETGPQVPRSILSCLQFSQHSKYEHMMDLPLSFNFPVIKPNVRSIYLDQPLNQGIPDQSVNTSVLTLSNGTLCVCYQHPVQPPTPKDDEDHDANEDMDPQADIRYTVTMPHHARELQGCVSGIPWSVAKTARISFIWMNDYLMIFLLGCFVHALDVNIEFEPCHHILLHRKTWEACQEDDLCPEAEQTEVKSVLSAATTATTATTDPDLTLVKSPAEFLPGPDRSLTLPLVGREAAHLGQVLQFIRKPSGVHPAGTLYDCDQGKVYQLGVNSDALVQIFSSCYLEATRQSILHYVMRQTSVSRDLSLLKQLFEMVANDCASPEVPVLMQEFLMGMTYTNLRRQVEKDVSQLLPFTTSESFRGVFEKINTGELLSRVSYSNLQSVNIGTKSGRERQQRRVAEDLWDNLCLHLRSRQIDQPSRFSQDRAEYKHLLRAMEKSNSPSALSQTQEKDSFLGKISARARTSLSLPSPGSRGRSDSVLGVLPPFLSEGTLNPRQDKLINLTEKLFAAHLGKYLRKDSKIKVANVAKEYISCQMQQAKQLCHMLWSIRGPEDPSEYIQLTERASEQEYELFQLFERFYMAVQELAYPIPPGFNTYFTVMGYRALDLSLFLQYVDRGVLMLTGEFVAQIMEDLPDDDADAQIKLQIISRLPKPLAEECFQKWDHHIAYRHTAMQQVSRLLKDSSETKIRSPMPRTLSADSYGVSGRDLDSHDGVHSVFHPLDTLMHLMQEREREQQIEEGKSVDSGFIRDVATFYTAEDLSTINF